MNLQIGCKVSNFMLINKIYLQLFCPAHLPADQGLPGDLKIGKAPPRADQFPQLSEARAAADLQGTAAHQQDPEDPSGYTIRRLWNPAQKAAEGIQILNH